jgi:hypothetical protein
MASPSLIEVGGKTYAYYTGSPSGPSGTNYQVMAATAPVPLSSLVQGNEGMAIAFVQSPVPPAFTSATSYPSAFSSNNTTGNLVVVGAYINSTTATMSVSDTQGNAYSVACPATSDGVQQLQLWYTPNCKGGPNTVTVSQNGSAVAGSLLLVEYSGINTLDQKAITASATGTAAASAPVITTTANELLVGLVGSQNGGITTTQTLGTGTNIRQNLVNSFSIFDRIVSSTGTFQATATVGSGNWVAGIATFSQSIGSGAYHVNRFRKFII